MVKMVIILRKKHFELSPLILWIALWTVNTHSEFQVKIFSNNRDITKCHNFLHEDDNNEDDGDKAVAILRVFSESSWATKRLNAIMGGL